MHVVTKNNEYYYDNDIGLILPYSKIMGDILNIDNWNERTNEEIISLLSNKYNSTKIIFYYKWLKKYYYFRNNILEESNYENQNRVLLNKSNIEDYILKNGLTQLILSVTEDCNFRCTYCTFSEDFSSNRNHSTKYMDFKTSKKAIDLYLTYINRGKKYNLFRSPMICFYGGEPLLNFDLIEKSVEYVHSNYGEDVKFNITTNGYLLDKNISDWLMKNEFMITVSLDGDEKEHNRKRINKNGKGTFNKVFSNIKYILNKKYEHFYVSPVFDYTTSFSDCHNFFKSNLIKVLSLSEVDTEYTYDYYRRFTENDYENYIKLIKELIENYSIENTSSSYLYYLIEEPFVKLIFESNILSFSRNFVNFTGSCVPSDKLFVSTGGNFYTCERVPPTDISNIGNINIGLDSDKIINIINNFNCKLKECSYCNISTLCQKCYKQFIDGSDFKEAKILCSNRENETKQFISSALSFLEKHQINLENKHIRYEKLYDWRD